MNWFRTRSRSAARLALFALAVQMVLSFGHLHRDDLGLPPLATTGQAPGQAQGPAQVSADATSALRQSDPHQLPASDDYCAICASIALIATAVASPPPALIVPDQVRPVWPEPAPAETIALDLVLSFRARAPPLI